MATTIPLLSGFLILKNRVTLAVIFLEEHRL